jgi:hypothetical protein
LRENLLNTVAQTRVCAFLHLRFFDNLFALLHLYAEASTFVLVDGMAHAQAAPTAKLVLLSRRPGQC